MAAIFVLARHKESQQITHIRNVNYNERNDFICTDINCSTGELVCVLNTESRHFRHKSENPNCKATFETALHQAAKEILKDNKFIRIPNQGILNYKEAILEQSWDKYRPDVTLKTDDEDWFVEIVVSHSISEDKELGYSIKNKRCLEIDLSAYDREFTHEQLTEDIRDKLTYKRMLLNDGSDMPNSSNKLEDLIIIGLAVAACAGVGYLVYREVKKPKKRKSRNWIKR